MNKFNEFMEEVQNDMRQARFEKYWKLYGKQFITLCIVLLCFASVYTLYQGRQDKLMFHSSDKFIAAQNAIAQGNYDESLIILDNLSSDATPTYKMLSAFSKVGLHLKKGDKESVKIAISLLKTIESDTKIEKSFRDFAKLLRYSHQLYDLDVLGEEFNAMRLDLDKIIQQETVWSYMAKELKGLIFKRVGSNADAADIFIKLIQDPNTPQIIKLRSQLMGQSISAKIIK